MIKFLFSVAPCLRGKWFSGTVGAYAGVLGRLGVDTLFRAEEKNQFTTEALSHGHTETRSEP